MGAAHAAGQRAFRILIADDDALFAESVATVLAEDDRLEIIGRASTGDEAVSLAGSLRPDLVLMDISMPRGNGIDATRRITAAHPGTPVLILTSSRSQDDVRRAAEAGAVGYLTKDTVTDDLAAMILGIAALATAQAPSSPVGVDGSARDSLG